MRVRRVMKEVLGKRGYGVTGVADEGGFGPALLSNEEALRLMVEAFEQANLRPGEEAGIALDIAATHFYRDGAYRPARDRADLDSTEMVERLAGWTRQYPIFSIEDGLDEEDWAGWKTLTERLGEGCQILGDDLSVTNLRRLEKGNAEGVANAVPVKMNEIGTVTETLDLVRAAQKNGYRPVISARSGEIEDDSMADLTVAPAAGQIKIGSVAGSERLAKYNRLLPIEEDLGRRARYRGAEVLAGWKKRRSKMREPCGVQCSLSPERRVQLPRMPAKMRRMADPLRENNGVTESGMMKHGKQVGKCSTFFFLALTAAAVFAAERRQFKPGFNIFSPAQDVELGREAAAQADKAFAIVKNKNSAAYLNELGKRLVRYAPGETDYPWEFKFVNAEPINAFALPGGFIYVNRGTVEAARNESELAGVVAHEIGHVVMRHSTNRASKAVVAQAPLRIIGGLLGGGAIGQLAQMGVGFGFSSVMLKYSRDAETQSDQIATYILYDAGYDPKSMATFFQILEQKYPKRTTQFFSSHPNPGNRVRNVEQEIPRLGPAKQYRRDTRAFRGVKRQFGSLPYPRKTEAAAGGASPAGSSAPQPPPPPSSRTKIHEADDYLMEYPSNWQLRKGEQDTAFFPERGMVQLEGGGSGQAFGAVVGILHSPRLEALPGA